MNLHLSRIASRRLALSASAVALAIGVSACGTAETPAAPSPTAAAPKATATATPTATPTPAPAVALKLTDVWARATPGLPDENSAIYALIENPNEKADRIVSASVPETIAKKVELHITVQEGGMMQMKQVEGFDVPAKGTLKLQPGGNHIMLLGLAKQFKAGDTFTVSLKLQSGATVESKVEVKTPPAGAMPGGHAPGGMAPGGMAPGGTGASGPSGAMR
jgi:copper(I)-binding protein